VALNTLWGLGHSQQQLESMAAELGSDMPFCVAGGIQLCFGRGERLEPISAPVASLGVVLVKDPTVSVSTPWAYGECRRVQGNSYLLDEPAFEQRRQALRRADWLMTMQAHGVPPLHNDLQAVVAPQTPSVLTALSLLEKLPGQLRVAMSGSGPSCFALFANRELAEQALVSTREAFNQAGLAAWSCSFQPEGVKLTA
jgi:4-diphosphocytidyl-2-C-methyl-D-erythritol kinase